MNFRIFAAFTAGIFVAGVSGVQADTILEPGAQHPTVVASGDTNIGGIIIDEVAKRLIKSYYQTSYDEYVQQNGKNKKSKKKKGLPPGLAKRGELPPGLAKQLARNGHLPPGLQERELPSDLLSQLPPLSSDYRYAVVDNKVMLVQRATNVILDVLTVAAIDLLD